MQQVKHLDFKDPLMQKEGFTSGANSGHVLTAIHQSYDVVIQQKDMQNNKHQHNTLCYTMKYTCIYVKNTP